MATWLKSIGLDQYEAMLAENDIDFEILVDLTEDDLRELPISFGHRKRLVKAIAEYNQSIAAPTPPEPQPTATTSPAPLIPQTDSDGTRRQITVMFCDLVGSTAIAAERDPEDMFRIISAYHSTCTDIIRRHGGHVARIAGDGVLAYFGFPVAEEGEAERAVRASLALVDAVRAIDIEDGLVLNVRIGIDTGLVVISDLIGHGSAEEDAIFGDSPNLAARLQSMAEPGQILISQNTRRLIGSLFELLDLDIHKVKGFDLPIRLFRVIGTAATESRFVARRGDALGPLVGREQESALLLARWRTARAGEGQVVLISGEGGIGKSHLVQQLRAAVARDAPQTLLYDCSQFYSNTAFHVLAEQLIRAAGIQPSDAPDVKLTKLETIVLPGANSAQVMPLMAMLCGIPTGERYPALSTPPEARKAAILSLFSTQLDMLCADGPVLILVEDAHWIDPSSNELLGQTIARVHELPLLIVITHRPEVDPSWPGQVTPTRLQLTRLDRQNAERVIDRFSGGGLPPLVKKQILEKSDGVPLYLEEITKAVVESEALSPNKPDWGLPANLPDLQIPATLHDSLMARLDRLSAVKEVAQVAAILGRTFSFDLLQAISDIDAERLRLALTELVRAELLYRRGTAGNESYAFKHALLQDTAYASQLRGRRQRLHGRAAAAMEETRADIVCESPEILAHHWREAGEPSRAFPYYLTAGGLALSRYANTEARVRFNEAVEAASTTAQKAEALLARARVPGTRAEIQADQSALIAIRDDVAAVGNDALLAQVDYWIARLHYIQGSLEEAITEARAAFELAERAEGGARVAADAANLLGRILAVQSKPLESVKYIKRNIEQMAELGDDLERAGITSVMAFSLGVYGDFDAAIDAANQGVALAEKLDHLPTRAAGYFYRGVVTGWRGEVEDAEPDFEEAIELSRAAGDLFRVYVSHGWRGQAFLHVGELAAAEADLDRALDLGEQIGTGFHRAAFLAFRAELDLRRGSFDLGSAERAVAMSETQPWAHSIAQRVYGEILSRDDPERARHALQTALSLQRQRECGYDAAWTELGLARLLLAIGNRDQALALAGSAERAFGGMGMRAGIAAAQEIGEVRL
tara:strand:- start:372 stop:3671 length:3300 start_codon:yes stop_codon:yes gene_type:complete